MNRRYLLQTLALPLCSFAVAVRAAEVTVIGTWVDDVGSPKFMDAQLTIEREGDRYFVVRRNGDGSGSRMRLERDGNTYIKVGDKFGAMYKVTAQGLEIHDRRGLIRAAKRK